MLFSRSVYLAACLSPPCLYADAAGPDWCASAGFPGESPAVPMTHRDNSTGTIDVRTRYLYCCSFSLPQNRNVVVLAMTTNARAR